MKPLFLDCPPRYTRIAATLDDPVAYACAISRRQPARFPWAWLALLALLAVGGMLL